MSKAIDKLVDDILEVVLDDMDCHHEVEHDTGFTQTSVEYNLKYEAKVRGKILALLEPKVTEEWIEEKAVGLIERLGKRGTISIDFIKDFIRSLVKED